MTKAEMQEFFFGETPPDGWKYYEIATPPEGFTVPVAGAYCTADCYCTESNGLIILATSGTCSIGTEVTE